MNNLKLKVLVAASFLPFAALAQTVPAIDKTASVAPAVQLPYKKIYISEKDRHALDLAAKWKKNPDLPIEAEDGSVKYLYGATFPVLICAPLKACAIELEPGEMIINEPHAGDSVRWRITPTMTGSGETSVSTIIIKPTAPGLTTNLIVTTDRRFYTIGLKSAEREWMPRLSFAYPEAAEAAWASYQSKVDRAKEAATLPTGESIHNLDFSFKLGGDNPKWKPTRVYTDGVKTYIQFPSANFTHEAPALVALGKAGGFFSDPEPQIVNYRVIGDRYVVDQVLHSAMLISGVGGSQTKVTIDYAAGE